MKIDVSIMISWIVPAFIAFIFGALSAWLTHRFQRKQDDIAWNHEKEKLQAEFQIGLTRLKEEVRQDLYKQRELSVRNEILPTIWKNLLNTQGKIGVVTSVLKQYPDLNHWTVEQIEEFFQKSVLSDFHKKQIHEAPDKLAYYQKVIIWYEISDARQAHSQFHNHMLYNKIFIDEDLSKRLTEIDDSFSNILTELEVHYEAPQGTRQELRKAIHDYNQKAENLKMNIELSIQQRLNS